MHGFGTCGAQHDITPHVIFVAILGKKRIMSLGPILTKKILDDICFVDNFMSSYNFFQLLKSGARESFYE